MILTGSMHMLIHAMDVIIRRHCWWPFLNSHAAGIGARCHRATYVNRVWGNDNCLTKKSSLSSPRNPKYLTPQGPCDSCSLGCPSMCKPDPGTGAEMQASKPAAALCHVRQDMDVGRPSNGASAAQPPIPTATLGVRQLSYMKLSLILHCDF